MKVLLTSTRTLTISRHMLVLSFLVFGSINACLASVLVEFSSSYTIEKRVPTDYTFSEGEFSTSTNNVDGMVIETYYEGLSYLANDQNEIPPTIQSSFDFEKYSPEIREYELGEWYEESKQIQAFSDSGICYDVTNTTLHEIDFDSSFQLSYYVLEISRIDSASIYNNIEVYLGDFGKHLILRHISYHS